MSGTITTQTHRVIEDPCLHIVLYQPEIPANTGNIARLCGAAELTLHLIHPLGFSVDDRHLKRAGLDYWSEIDVRHHSGFDAFMEDRDRARALHVFTRHTCTPYVEAKAGHGDYLLFGRETRGLPTSITGAHPCYSIPIWGKVRSLNLSTAVGIVSYHYLHALGRF